MRNYIICGSQNSGKTTQAYAIAGLEPLKVSNIFDIRHIEIEDHHTSIVIDDVESTALIFNIIKQYPPFRYRKKFSKEILELTLPIIVVTSVPTEDVLSFMCGIPDKDNWSVLTTNYPSPTVFHLYEENC